jgi:uracil-DNA glycosylase
MAQDEHKRELIDLIGTVKESLIFGSELGLDLVENPKGFTETPKALTAEPPSRSEASRRSPALERNAFAAEKPVGRSSTESPRTNQYGNREARKRASEDVDEMPKRTGSSQLEKTGAQPQETLFGTVLETDEGSRPKPGETLEDIHNDIGDCTRCPLFEGRTHVVNSEGNPNARLMFVGEAPGADEDAQARPFVGRAGQLLNKIIEAIGLTREDVYIGNVNRCRPPANRTPTITEAATCKTFLLREIAVVKPEVIVVLGNTAMKNLLETKEGITRVRGIFQDYKGIKVMPTFHPAYLLRDPSKKRETWEDMKKVKAYLDSKSRA